MSWRKLMIQDITIDEDKFISLMDPEQPYAELTSAYTYISRAAIRLARRSIARQTNVRAACSRVGMSILLEQLQARSSPIVAL